MSRKTRPHSTGSSRKPPWDSRHHVLSYKGDDGQERIITKRHYFNPVVVLRDPLRTDNRLALQRCGSAATLTMQAERVEMPLFVPYQLSAWQPESPLRRLKDRREQLQALADSKAQEAAAREEMVEQVKPILDQPGAR
mmetsp:Transcript_128963/g.223764  ORF Transcript_128963/g.223764 Transcript_128963/m.223764 type:complete len:138 (-) Transcript_128963:234-647(-)